MGASFWSQYSRQTQFFENQSRENGLPLAFTARSGPGGALAAKRARAFRLLTPLLSRFCPQLIAADRLISLTQSNLMIPIDHQGEGRVGEWIRSSKAQTASAKSLFWKILPLSPYSRRFCGPNSAAFVVTLRKQVFYRFDRKKCFTRIAVPAVRTTGTRLLLSQFMGANHCH